LVLTTVVTASMSLTIRVQAKASAAPNWSQASTIGGNDKGGAFDPIGLS